MCVIKERMFATARRKLYETEEKDCLIQSKAIGKEIIIPLEKKQRTLKNQ